MNRMFSSTNSIFLFLLTIFCTSSFWITSIAQVRQSLQNSGLTPSENSYMIALGQMPQKIILDGKRYIAGGGQERYYMPHAQFLEITGNKSIYACSSSRH